MVVTSSGCSRAAVRGLRRDLSLLAIGVYRRTWRKQVRLALERFLTGGGMMSCTHFSLKRCETLNNSLPSANATQRIAQPAEMVEGARARHERPTARPGFHEILTAWASTQSAQLTEWWSCPGCPGKPDWCEQCTYEDSKRPRLHMTITGRNAPLADVAQCLAVAAAALERQQLRSPLRPSGYTECTDVRYCQ